MKIDLKDVKNIKTTNTKNVIDLLRNTEEYSTEVFLKKDIVNGKTVLRGVFSSVKKDNGKVDDFTSELDEGQFYYSHNVHDLKLTYDDRVRTYKNAAIVDNNFDWKMFLFYSVLIVVLIELAKYFTYIRSENKLIADKCYEVMCILT
jgi:hypothetical protein